MEVERNVKTMDVKADVKWNRTGVFSSPTTSIWVTVIRGGWRANPNWPSSVDGKGYDRYPR